MMRSKLAVLGSLGVVATLIALVALRWRGPDMGRPFTTDELLTVRFYTWVGVQPSGEQRRLDHIDDFYAVGPPSAAQLAMGVYCGMGRWPEPNNHVVNSLLVSAALAAGERDERCTRLPALLGAVAFAAALYFLCSAVLRWWAAAPLAALWAWFLPYTVVNSQTARGFTWMLALEVVMILLAYLLARRPGALALAALTVAVAALSLLNVVSMAVDWVLPYFLALYLVRPRAPDEDAPPTEGRAAWRRGVLAQALVVAALGALFFVSHLPSLYSSARQYGLAFHSPGEFFARGGQVLDELFPGAAAKALALVGGAGLLALGFDRRYRFLAVLAGLVVVVSLGHYLAGGRFPYGRAAGHVVPFVLLGAAYLAERIIRVYESTAGRALMFGALALLTLGLAAAQAGETLESKSLSECLALARRARVPEGHKVHVPIRSGNEYLIAAYGPREWEVIDVVPPDVALTVVLFDAERPPAGASIDFLDATRHRLSRLSGATRPLAAAGPVPPGAWVYWYPDFTRLGIDAREQDAYVRESGCPFLPAHARYQIKFDVYSHVQCYVFFASATSPVGDVVREGVRRFGGRAVVFVPKEEEVVR